MGLYRRKDGKDSNKVWWMSFSVNGRSYRRSTGTADKRLAEKVFAKVQTQIVEQKWFDIEQSSRRALGEMIEKYEREYTDYKDYYQKARDKSIFKSLRTYFGDDCTLANMEPLIGGYEQYRKTQGRKTATILKELGLLRRMFNVARKQWKWKIINPVSEIELPKVRNERVRYLEPHEYKNLLAVTEKTPETWLNPLVVVAIDTGLRLTNLCNLLWTEVNLFSRMITIDAEKMKNDDYIGLPLTERAYQTLKELQRVQCVSGHVFHDAGQPLYDRKVQRAFRKALDAAGIGNFHFHDLRHTFASYLRQQGVDLHTIAVLMGHRDLRMTKRYAHLNVDSLKDAVSKLNFTNFSRIDGQEGKKVAVPTGFEPVF